ncbi:hypothetical protein A0J48_021810 [Sphaerospermopsis aphanizomenoides BCCUSP55]|uniref:HEPN domain-containing protein n=1 Tax=Sphaerospermopsis aphanizomenoides TaxID=459663 RepID=UPI000AA171DB|nr:HEPN domain-containing protein [Sphaerospermopsis aphanizomenoides]MBK1990129.1 hypothetical protein [Sphaerospermopsis aphanizomenoides BCCUSP55]
MHLPLPIHQFPKKFLIADGIRYISNQPLWDEVAKKISRTDKDVKQQLNSIVYRRNKIAHEADIDPTLGLGNRWNIDELMVGDTVDFIEQVVESIHQML